jgi:hypothetical protein
MSKMYVNELLPKDAARVAIPGHVIQVVDASSSTQISVTSGSPTSAGFNLSITPTFTNSKLIVQGILAGEAISSGGTDYGFKYRLYRNGSSVYNAEYDIYMSSNNNQRIQKVPILFTQTANTTSTLTFEVYFNNTGSSSNARLNYYGAPSRLVIMEIAQ